MGELRNGFAPDTRLGRSKIFKKKIQTNSVLIHIKIKSIGYTTVNSFLNTYFSLKKILTKGVPEKHVYELIACQDIFFICAELPSFYLNVCIFSLEKRTKKTAMNHFSRFHVATTISLMWLHLPDNFAPTKDNLLVGQ